jgi:succinoglycan biosynthesis transport protein ExoP
LLSLEVDKLQTEKTSSEVSEEQSDNPAYINLKTQISSAEMQIKSFIQQKTELKEKIEEYQTKLEKAPLIEKEYNDLMHDYENARFKYNEVMNKLMEAKIAQGMEESQQGERFTIIDPAQLPEKPYKPNRLAIILIGFVLALGAGVGIAAVQEAVNVSVKTSEDLGSITGFPVFSTISMIETDEELQAKRKKKWLWIGSAVGAVILALIIIHFFIMPLDIAWIKVQRRLHIL